MVLHFSLLYIEKSIMKHLLLYFLLSVMSITFASCDDEQEKPNGYIEQTEAGSITIVAQGYISAAQGFNTIKPAGLRYPFYIDEQKWAGQAYKYIATSAKRLDNIAEAPQATDEAWKDNAPIVPGCVYWLLCENGNEYRFIKMRVAYVQGNNVGIEYVLTDRTEERTVSNSNSNDDINNEAAKLLEMPRLNPNNFFTAHYVSFNGQEIMNLAVEWNKAVRHSSWVAFSWDKTTSQDLVSRNDNWKWDPSIPFDEWNGVEEANHKSDGYDKGHLCASEDRVYCKEANEHTFYYSNISPQLGGFNQQYWAGLEDVVRKWGRSTSAGKFDKVYVAKGGAINNLLHNFKANAKGQDGVYPTADANGFSIGGLAVPAYYFMALLAEKNGKFTAIGFLVPHSENLKKRPASNSDYQEYAVSIDKLEKETGIDFFCNLEDKTEDEVERAFSVTDWEW